jgi:hypothetical protein
MGKSSKHAVEKGRFTARRKGEAVLRLLRGEDLDVVSRELGIPANKLSEWRESFLAAGETSLKSREPTPQDDEVLRLRALVGDLMMRNELLREKNRAMEAGRPLALRRSKT